MSSLSNLASQRPVGVFPARLLTQNCRQPSFQLSFNFCFLWVYKIHDVNCSWNMSLILFGVALLRKKRQTSNPSHPPKTEHTHAQKKRQTEKKKAPGHVKLSWNCVSMVLIWSEKSVNIFVYFARMCRLPLVQPAVSWAINSCSVLYCRWTWSVLGAPSFLCQEWIARYNAPSYIQLHKSLGYKLLL